MHLERIVSDTALPRGLDQTGVEPPIVHGPYPENQKDKLWYVLYELPLKKTWEFSIPRTTSKWTWFYTKTAARDFARECVARKIRVVDIFRGTIARPTHKAHNLRGII